MSMSKKDYQAIAKILYNADTLDKNTIQIKDRMASYFAVENPKFDVKRFEEACLTGKCKGMKGV